MTTQLRTSTPAPIPPSPAARNQPRTEGRGIALMIGGGLAALIAVALLLVAGMGIYFDTQRDSAGYVSTDSQSYSTATYAFVSDSYRAGASGDVFVPADVLGKIRVHVRSTKPVFVGVGPAAAVTNYLGRVAREEVSGFDAKSSDTTVIPGRRPVVPPAAQKFWKAQTTATGDASIRWEARSGDWRVVVMNPDGSAGLNAAVAVGAQFPHIVAIAIALLGAALVFGGVSALLLRLGLRRLDR